MSQLNIYKNLKELFQSKIKKNVSNQPVPRSLLVKGKNLFKNTHVLRVHF